MKPLPGEAVRMLGVAVNQNLLQCPQRDQTQDSGVDTVKGHFRRQLRLTDVHMGRV